MKLVTYHVKDVRQGLEKIKGELGNQAVIVETSRVTSGSQAGMLEIVVGIEETPMGLSKPSTKASGSARASQPSPAPSQAPAPAPAQVPGADRTEMVAMMGLVEDLRAQILTLKQEVHALRSEPRAARTPTVALPAELRREIQAELQRLPGDGTESAARTVSFLYQLLTNQGVLPDHIEEILAFALGSDDWSRAPRRAQELLHRELTRRITTTDPLWHTSSSAQEVAVLVGPTGVGKTTTLAKIAAHAQVAGRKKVGIICADPCRVGGAYQIRTYAELMEIPSQDVATTEEFHLALSRFSDRDLILVDTTGQTPWARATRGLPLERMQTVTTGAMDLQFHLCLSASTRAADLVAISDQMGHLPLRSLIFTKIDEATSLGGLLSSAMHTGLPLSVLGDGPTVPQDILVPTAREIATWIQFERTAD